MNFDDLPSELSDSQTESFYVNRKLYVLLSISILLLLAGVGYWLGWFSSQDGGAEGYSGAPPAVVEVASAQRITMAPHTVLPGTVVSLRDAVIASEARGKILSVSNIGDVVAQGDTLAEIDSSDALHLVSQRQAELQRLQSLLTYHTDYFKRIGAAKNKLGVSEVGIAELRSNRDTAKAEVARAQAALLAAKNDLRRTGIQAPFPGSVVSQSIQQGEYAQAGSPIVRLVDTVNLEVSARVPASLVQPIEAGTMLEISGMGQIVKAPLRALVPVGDAVSRTMELRVALEGSDLLVGSPVRVSLPSALPKNVLAIPRDAVILRTDSQYVYVIEDGKASKREVTLGYAQDDMIEVLGDVPDAAIVVIRGGERLRDGQAVTWQNMADETSSASLESSDVESGALESTALESTALESTDEEAAE